MQTMNILKEHNVNILNVNLSQARIEIVADEIENSLVELLHKKLIKKGEWRIWKIQYSKAVEQQ